MIIDHRTYTLHPGKLGAWLDLWERKALPYQLKYLENFVGMFTCDVGDLNQVVHMWRYEDQGDRERRRTAMYADPGWQEFMREVGELGALKKTKNKILKPVPFSPMQ